MREILFRGKRIDNGEWVYGDLLQFQDRTTIHYYVNGCRTADDVVPSTVGQSTGLTDSNGKKIFEGDIVRQHFSVVVEQLYDEVTLGFIGDEVYEGCHVGYVTITNKGAIIRVKSREIYSGDDIHSLLPKQKQLAGYRCEVIGNIYDNPELMKGGEQ